MFDWDTSNRLKQITGPGYAASFTYDVIGRRVTRSVNGDTTAFAYSGMQLVGEIRAASTVPQQSTALVTGAQIDEVIARYSRTGATSDTPVGRVLLTDALGSVIAQTREDQSVQNFYSYTPYGEVLPIGDDEKNSTQYTGRESDSTGLYFYRARYYDPVLKRFIAQDPIGLSGGMNVYGYVEGNPVSFVDPFGETIYKGPNNSYSDIPPPAGQPCLRAIERYGAIVGWEPCTPPTPPSDPCPPQPPAPPPPPPTPPGNGPGTGTGAGPGTGPGGGGPGSGGTNQGCYWACISAGIGTYIVDTMTMGIFTDGIFPSLFDAAAVNNSIGQRVFWGGMKWASRGFGIIHVFHGAWGLNQSAPAMCEKACAE
jgi:RHS repeat-associated protein